MHSCAQAPKYSQQRLVRTPVQNQRSHLPTASARARSLPREMRLREAPSQFLQRHAEALLASRAGVAASYYGACGLLFAVATALHGAFTRHAAALHVLCCACVRQLAVLLCCPAVLGCMGRPMLAGSNLEMAPQTCSPSYASSARALPDPAAPLPACLSRMGTLLPG